MLCCISVLSVGVIQQYQLQGVDDWRTSAFLAKMVNLVKAHEAGDLRVCYLRHNSEVCICSGGSDGKIHIFKGQDMELLTSTKNDEGPITSIGFSQKLSALVYGDKLGGVKVCLTHGNLRIYGLIDLLIS